MVAIEARDLPLCVLERLPTPEYGTLRVLNRHLERQPVLHLLLELLLGIVVLVHPVVIGMVLLHVVGR